MRKQILINTLTPKESNVFSKWMLFPTYDSYGVEHINDRRNFYKHAIPSGLDIQRTQKTTMKKSIIQLITIHNCNQ